MKHRARPFVIFLLLVTCVSGVGLGAPRASAAEPDPGAAGANPELGGPLIVPSSDQLLNGEQAHAAVEVGLASPESVADRERSQVAFAKLGAAEARSVAAETFPALLDHPAGGPPALSPGDKITRFLTPDAAQLLLADGEHAVIETAEPLASASADGGLRPIDLSLVSTANGYVPANAPTEVSIPKRLSDGVAVSYGLSLTPIAASGAQLVSTEGMASGPSVFFPNTGTDTDTLVKATASGVELAAILRAPDSPKTLYYRVGLPAGARLRRDGTAGGIEIVTGDATLGVVDAPTATDAAGSVVPASMTIDGDTLAVVLPEDLGSYQLPIDVDPELHAIDNELYRPGHLTNWLFHANAENHFEPKGALIANGEKLEQLFYVQPTAQVVGGEYAMLQYETQGESHVYEAVVGSRAHVSSFERTQLEFITHEGSTTNKVVLGEGTYSTPYTQLCVIVKSPCLSTFGGAANAVRFMGIATGTDPAFSWTAELTGASVQIAQNKPPTTTFGTAEEVPAGSGRKNVLFASGSWLSPSEGAFEVTAHDPGIGVSNATITGSGLNLAEPILAQGKCRGLQCNETYSTPVTYSTSLADGEDLIQWHAEDAMGFSSSTTATIKVDGTKPRALKMAGIPEQGGEINASPHELTFSAIDGTAPIRSSGVKSLAVSLDGGPQTLLVGSSCPVGECTATGKWTLHAEGLTEGLHHLILTATDNAGNPSAVEYTFNVRHGTPLDAGPGKVDSTTGQFTMSSVDVSLGGGVGVSRTYQSRALTSGLEGPLGPQWTLSLGRSETLTVLPEGSVGLTTNNGGHLVFERELDGSFESPPGDSNLKLEATEQTKGSGVTEYDLANQRAGTKTVFRQPAGSNALMLYSGQLVAEEGKLDSPITTAVGEDGDTWVANYNSGRIERFSPTGSLLANYGAFTGAVSPLVHPWGIAISETTGNVFLTDGGNNRVDVLAPNGTFLRAFGWGVADGAEQLEVCTTTCYAGLAGTGNGQLDSAAGVTVDPGGNVWVANQADSMLEEYSEAGTFVRAVGGTGGGSGQLNNPLQLTVAGGNVYVTDYFNSRVEEFSAATGAYVGQFGSNGSGNGQFQHPNGIASNPATNEVYVVDDGRVQAFTRAGTFVGRFGAKGEGAGQFAQPYGIAFSREGTADIADMGGKRVELWTPPTWEPSVAEGPTATGTASYSYQAIESGGRITVQPTEVLAPVPAGVTCGAKVSELTRGCRALSFHYAEQTTATGESQGQWGEYKGRLTLVEFTAWDPSKTAMTTKAVAQYSYDKQGRLRAQWNPSISPALKTMYGYDGEGHVTAQTRAGEETWALTYGAIASDPTGARILKVNQAPATAELWNGNVTTSTEAPKLSGTASVANRMSVSDGGWTNGPISYGYQWQSCNAEGAACTSIAGATNATYSPTSADIGHTLVAMVIATNGGGSESRSSSHSLVVIAQTSEAVEGAARSAQPGTTLEYRIPVSGSTAPYQLGESEIARWGQTDVPTEGTAIFPPDEPVGWPASDYRRATITYLDGRGLPVNTATPSGAISTTEYNPTNNVVRTLTGDNRITALEAGSKAAEVSKKLDTEQSYGPKGGSLLESLGPEHAIKLADGTEAQGRDRARMFYDEGAPNGEGLGLVTRSTNGALLPSGEERDVRTETTSYSGQSGLGWALRKPTSTSKDPAGLDLVSTTVYDPSTGNVVETRNPGGNSETIYPPAFASAAGGEGSANGQYKQPGGGALDPAGNLWIPDAGNNRVQKLSPSGAWLASYGVLGSGNLQFKSPRAIAINQTTGNVYVADTENNRIEELNSAGTYVGVLGATGSGALKEPEGVTVDPAGNIWVGDTGHSRLVEFNIEGNFTREVGALGTSSGQLKGPTAVVISEGSVFVVDAGNNRVEQFSGVGTYLGQFGTLGKGTGQFKEPFGVAANPSTGNLYVADKGNNRIQEFSPAGRFLTSWETWGPSHQLSSPIGLVIGNTGKLYVTDFYGAKVTTWTPPEAGAAHLNYSAQIGSTGSGAGQFTTPIDIGFDGEGNIWASDLGNNRIEKFSAKGSFIAAYGSLGSGNGKFNQPGGIDVNQSTGAVYVADTNNGRVEQFSSSGTFVRAFGAEGAGKLTRPGSLKLDSAGDVWVPDIAASKIFEFTASGAFIAAYGKEGTGEVSFKKPVALAFAGENLYVADSGNHRVQELTTKGNFVRNFGIEGRGSGELYVPEGIAADAAGDLYVVDNSAGHVEEFNSSGAYLATYASGGSGEGQLKGPVGDALDAAGNLYVADTEDNRLEKWTAMNPAVHATRTVFYSTAANNEYPQCGGHPEWSNLICHTGPVAQPKNASLGLPTTTLTYNLWDEIETKTEALGSTVRTTNQSFDAAGRALTSEETSTAGGALPKVTNEFSTTSGRLIKKSTTAEGVTKVIASTYDTLGRLVSYTDADANTSKFTYDINDRVEEMSDGKGSQIYVHDPTTGYLTQVLDSAAGKFTAAYDAEGEPLTETYPGGLSARYGYAPTGQATHLEYVKTTHCATACTWFTDAIAPSIHGETLAHANTLASENFTFDSVGRLTRAQETPAAQGCTTRTYGYDEEGSRTANGTYQPAVGGACATEAGTSERHIFDEAGRLADSGATYDPLGNTTALPPGDAGGKELTASYFVDNQVRSQSQGGQTLTYSYDPDGRAREVVGSGKTNSNVISHYSGSGEALSWAAEGSTGWTRYIPGIDGGLVATQANGGAPLLRLHDLQGNVVATLGTAETETKLTSTYNSTEFGVPTTSSPPRYSWLGDVGVATTELTAGVTEKEGASYVPQIARTLQTEAIAPPGAFPNGAGTGSPYTATVSQASIESADAVAHQVFEEVEAARQRAAAEEAARLQEECIAAGACLPYIDPPEVKYLNQTEAIAAYAGIGAGTGVLEAMNSFGFMNDVTESLFKAAVGFIGGHFTVDKVLEWAQNLDSKLGRCTNAMYIAEGTPKERNPHCRVEWDALHLFEFEIPFAGRHYLFSIPNFADLPKVSYCKYGHTWCYVK